MEDIDENALTSLFPWQNQEDFLILSGKDVVACISVNIFYLMSVELL